MNVPPLQIQIPGECQLRPTSIRNAERNLELLASIEASGSISRAAKRIRLSYKSAWDCVDAMNNLSQAPLIDYSAEVGTHLTEYGRRLLEAWQQLREAPPPPSRWKRPKSSGNCARCRSAPAHATSTADASAVSSAMPSKAA